MKTIQRLLPALMLSLSAAPDAGATEEDCPTCATVVELDQGTYSVPFSKWDNLISFVKNSSANNSEVKQISYNRDESYSYHFANSIRVNSTSAEFNAARAAAINSGQAIVSQHYGGPDRWLIAWGNNTFELHGYSLLGDQLNTLRSQGKNFKQIEMVSGSDAFLIFLSDNSYLASGIDTTLTAALNPLSTIKRVALSNDQKLAIIRTNGTVEFAGTGYSSNQLAFITAIQTEIQTNLYQADTIYFGTKGEMIFSARKSGSQGIIRSMGPIREWTEVATVGGNLELIQHLSPNYKYQLYRSQNLVTWQKIGPEVTGDNTFKKFITPIGADRGIYRFGVTFAAQ